jgi:hypothetical protein
VETNDEIKTADINLAKDLLQSILKAKKNLKMYPPNNPVYAKTAEDIYNKFRNFFENLSDFDLKIGRNELFFMGKPVYEGTGKDDNLALFFFRDGLRTLVFNEGLDQKELLEFLEILSVDFENEDVEDDLVTLLWNKSFANISYTVDESVLVDDEGYEEKAVTQAKEGVMQEENIKQAHDDTVASSEAEGPEETEGPGMPKEITVMPISEDDLKSISTEIEKNATLSNEKFFDILFDVLYMAQTIDEFKEIAKVINSAIEYSIRKGNLKTAVAVFKRIKPIAEKTESEELKKHLNIVVMYAGSSSTVKLIGKMLDSTAGVPGDVFREYVSVLGVNAIQPLITLLGELETISARKYIINALTILGKKDIGPLLKALRDDRWYVLRNIVHILRVVGNKKAVDHIVRIGRHEDIRVRKEILKTLGELGGQGVAASIKEYLNDTDKTVRITAVKALGGAKSELSKKVLMDTISEKSFLDKDYSEMRTYFEEISHWKDESTIAFLKDILNKSSLFNRSKHNELKACAIYCLGLIGDRNSLEELQKIKDSKNRLLSDYAIEAIKKIGNVRERRPKKH